MERATFEASVVLEEARTIVQSGKIYAFNNLLFVNEVNEGFHIFDNENPENPQSIAFIKAPGATDLAIKNDVYYVNQAVDLIAVTYNKDASELVVTKRIPNVFPEKISPDGFAFGVPADSIIIDYELSN